MANERISGHNAPTRRTGSTSGSKRLSVVRRVRIEHLAGELLREADALRIPVPVEAIYLQPPLDLWRVTQPGFAQTGAETRWALAQLIGRKIDASNWLMREKLFGGQTFTDEEIEIFAVALLLPSPLLSSLNTQQRTPEGVAHVFGVPEPIAAQRLMDLGYLMREAHFSVGNETTSTR